MLNKTTPILQIKHHDYADDKNVLVTTKNTGMDLKRYILNNKCSTVNYEQISKIYFLTRYLI